MAETDKIRRTLAALPSGAKVNVKLEDGTEIAGTFGGLDGDEMQIGDGAVADVDAVSSARVNVGKVESVLMDVSTAGPE